ncbi:MAG: peptidoglycan-binding domain-containing protein [Anderseniella sp.]|nr:peptidoglycan-binding domain-containing protein [Anderseniella sp.]
MASPVWMNLLKGDHQAFERSAAPAPVMIQPAPRQLSAGETSNTFPAASVNVSVVHQNQAPSADDPLGQLILQTGSIDSVQQQQPAMPEAEAAPGLILEAQQALAALKFYNGPVDGLVGPAHEEAVRTYQAMHGLPVTGIVTRPVLDHMQMTATVESASQTDIVVHKVQAELAKLGYSPGSIDGRMGEQTREAIKVFEADRGWPVTGQISSELLAELDGSGAVASATAN